MTEDWRELKVGDRIRIVRLPSEWKQPNWYVSPDTRRFYKFLIARRRAVRICWRDDFGMPWIRCRSRNGIRETLGIADDSWVRVKPRKAKAAKMSASKSPNKRPGKQSLPKTTVSYRQ